MVSTYDGKALKLYVNGELQATTALELKIAAGGHFWMARSDGVLKYTRDAHFRGKITDVRVYRRALAAEEIAHLTRTTNITGTVAVSAIPIPSAARLLLQLDKRGLGKTPPGLAVQADLLRDTADGQAISSVSVREFGNQSRGTATLPMRNMEAGQYVVRAVACDPSGKKIGSSSTTTFAWTPLSKFPRGPEGMKQLNNLVAELLSVAGPDSSGRKYTFVNPRRGWVFVSNRGTSLVELAAEGTARAEEIALHQNHGDAHEAMRLLPSGTYRIGTATAEQLVVRAIPEIVFARYDSNPHVREFGPYRGDFHQKYILKNVNTFVGVVKEPFAEEWKQHGGKWLVRCSVPRGTEEKPLTVEAAYDFIVQSDAFRVPHIDGLIADEFGNSAPYCATWARAVDRALGNPAYQGEVYYPYANDLWTGAEGIELMATLVKRGSAVAWKRYLKEQRTEADAWRFLNYRLVQSAENYRDKCPGSLPHIVACFGYFSAPPEQLDTFPHVNYKTYLEMQFNLVANHPAFEGLGGIMTYLASYADEETVRWAARLFRHYGIEGRTDMLGGDPYILTHLENGDFERKGDGWTLAPAEEGSIRFGISPGFSWLQGRYPRTSEGNTVIVTRRSAARPNVFSQQIRDLEPGRLYSFRMYSGDFKDLSAKQKHAVSIKLGNVEMIPHHSFTHVFANCYSHHYGSYDRKNKAWMNYHWRVFRAKGKTADLAVSDWPTAKRPGGPIGQEIMYNFVQVQPYYGAEE